MKIYEYILKLKDDFSKGYRDFIALGGSANSVVDGTKTKLQSAANASSGLESTFKSLGRTIATVFAIGTLATYAGDIRDITVKVGGLKSALSVTTGSGEGAFGFIRKESDRLGLSLMASSEGYKTFTGATMKTNLAGKQTEDIFLGVAEAASKMKVSTANQEGIFLTLGQMMSKGKVSAEELNGQLGERLPGALGLAARAMGTTKAGLLDMMQKGKLMAENFLPKFGALLRKEFGNGGQYVDTLGANMQRAADRALMLKVAIGDKLEPLMNGFYKTLIKVYDWTMANAETLKTLGIVVGYGTTAWLTYQSVMWGVAAVTAVQAVRISGLSIAQFIAFGTTNGLLGAQMALNAVFMANPIAWTIGLIFALVGAFTLAYNKVDWFRGGLWGLWEASKQVFTNIGDFFKKTFDPIFEAITAFKEGRYLDAGKAIGKLAINLTPVGMAYNFANTVGKGVGSSFDKGYASGVKKEGISLPGLGGASVMPAMAGADGGMGGGSSTSAGTSTSDGISAETGGKGRGQNVIVHLGGIKIEINVEKIDEGLDKLEDKIREVIARIVNGGLYTDTQ